LPLRIHPLVSSCFWASEGLETGPELPAIKALMSDWVVRLHWEVSKVSLRADELAAGLVVLDLSLSLPLSIVGWQSRAGRGEGRRLGVI